MSSSDGALSKPKSVPDVNSTILPEAPMLIRTPTDNHISAHQSSHQTGSSRSESTGSPLEFGQVMADRQNEPSVSAPQAHSGQPAAFPPVHNSSPLLIDTMSQPMQQLGRSRQMPGSRNLTHHQPAPMGFRPAWRTWLEVSVLIEHLPQGVTTLDLYSSFSSYGRIDSINIPRSNIDGTNGHAYINFSPVPQHSFWNSGVVTISVRDRQFRVRVGLRLPRVSQRIKSPVKAGVTYPESKLFRLTTLDFGFLSQDRAMAIMKTIRDDIFYPTLTINLKFRRLEMRFYCFIDDPRRKDPSILVDKERIGKRENAAEPSEFKVEIQFSHLKHIFHISLDNGQWCLIIPLETPPKFWRRRRDIAKSLRAAPTKWGDQDVWVRACEVSYADWSKNYPVSLQEPFQFIEAGRWTTYRLLFQASDSKAWDYFNNALRDFNIRVISTDAQTFTWKQGKQSIFRTLIDGPEARHSNASLALLHDAGHLHLPFDVRYQLEAAISQGAFSEQSVSPQFLQQLAKLNGERGRFVNKAKNVLEYVTDAKKRVYNPLTILQDRSALMHHTTIVLPEHCTWVRKVIVTPTTIYLSSPTPETTNRVLRQYANNVDRFIRVQFTDERTEGRIHATPNSDTNDALFNRVYRTLRHGIVIGDRHFKFLAFGNSQIRENGAYFFCPTEHQSCDDIRAWMGDFRHINVVAKYASRLGQCFSTTRDPKGLALGLTVRDIPDIESNGWTFSDGVGMISEWMAGEITNRLRLWRNGRVPSAFQFRLGGSKGILVTWPQVKFNEVYIRPSQNKFTARARNLEIIRASRFSTATLNRQTIVILSCLGVPDEVFIDMTEKQLSEYSTAMTNADVAQTLLGRFIDENGITTTIAQMVVDGFMMSREPFVSAILQLWRAWSMKLLREKARIVVEQGAFLFGCVDETRTLRGHKNAPAADTSRYENILPQVFLQVPRPEQPDKYQVIKGICVVGRNPSLHPGDLRVVEAVDVDVPELKALRDVIVFPADGDRDIPSMCSGGDLDGDDYFVFWDPKLIPQEWNFPPMLHDTVDPKRQDKDVTISDITRFFVEYMKNDSLSTIALAHVALSDRMADGPRDESCIELAKLHSNAVDYVKTGQPAHIPEELRPTRWPHFMERHPRISYPSQKVLGQLYNLVTKVDFSPDFERPFDERILKRYDIPNDILEKARGIKVQYDIAMRRIMNQREIRTEFEVWSAFVMTKPRVGSGYKMQEDLGIVMASLRDRFVQACVNKCEAEDGETQSKDMNKLYPFIAAMYRVTWEEVQICLEDCRRTRFIGGREVSRRSKDQMPFISFPWIFETELGRIATRATDQDLELKQLPDVPRLHQIANTEQATSYVAACMEDGRLFLRGEEIYLARESLGDGTSNEESGSDSASVNDQEAEDPDGREDESVEEEPEEVVVEESTMQEPSRFDALQSLTMSDSEDE
ncbi:uncharacterized protein JN550_004890 [Neoarthrinium moseri]|uniref:uncharacterized protein n=1 Tax=Neoarthrinium moseri TaxID=1658444 RepID=UPI001FDD1EC6|nr:uncharacterized protein JN550_004890 [Neoarthrinium moseri]KAI1870744.1 hypothetical protein JN550_004890 [Neoarthrinium moseri]